MSLVKFNSNRLFPSMFSLVDSFFDDEVLSRSSDPNLIPAVNVKETDSAYEVQVAAPGYEKGDIKVKVENGFLKINSEDKQEKEEVEELYTKREFSYKAFSRSFRLPDDINDDNIKATYEKGILSLILPKTEKKENSNSKEISIS